MTGPRARRGLATFVTQGLHLYELDALTKDPMLFEQYSTLLHELADMQTLFLTLSGGEPMVHPHFFEIGALIKP